jgi:hypothetical protein
MMHGRKNIKLHNLETDFYFNVNYALKNVSMFQNNKL